MNELIQKVAKMRDLQKQYLKKRDSFTLQAVKKAEREVDKLLNDIQLKERQEPRLF